MADRANKAAQYGEAERLYVQMMMGQADIARALGIAERTVRYWAAEGNWADRRKNYQDLVSSTDVKLHELVVALTDKAVKQAKEGEEISQSLLYSITRLVPLLKKMKEYEEAVAPADAEPEPEKPKQLSDDTIRRIEEEILGIRRP